MRDDQSLAVVGMALRLPGADDPERFWDNNEHGAVFVRSFAAAELLAAGVPRSDVDDPDFIAASAPLDDIAGFDADAFGMTPAEAALTDPQHRLFLEVCQHALEDAGYSGQHERVAVFGSTGYHLHPLGGYLSNNVEIPDGHSSALWTAFANSSDFVATKTAFKLGLTGPAMTVQTGCSAGLVGLRQARHALHCGDADLAIVASSAIHVPQILGYRRARGSVMSRDGVCRAFDAESDGTASGNGAVAVVLKRGDHARRDLDRVHARILAVAVNNDGAAKDSYAAPSVAGQVDVLRQALTEADISPRDIGYVETHGTGTFKGDPIEFAALDQVWRQHDWQPHGCALGAAKPSIGHLDSAAGLAGLIKAIGVLRRGVIPPLAGHTAPNPRLSLRDGPFRLPTASHEWPAGGIRRAGVTALGVGGTNAHVILEAPSPVLTPSSRPTVAPGVVPLSAASPLALRTLAGLWARYLARNPDTEMVDLVTTAALGRRAMPYRLAVLGNDVDSIRTRLAGFAGSGTGPDCVTGKAHASQDEVSATASNRELAIGHCAGAAVPWREVLAECRGRRVSLPAYPFQRQTHWLGPKLPNASPLDSESRKMNDPSPVLVHIQNTVAAQLGCDIAQVAADTKFAELGADSLSMVHIGNDLERNFGVRVSMRELFELGETPTKLAALVSQRSTAATAASDQATVPQPAAPPQPVASPQQGAPPQPATPSPPAPTAPMSAMPPPGVPHGAHPAVAAWPAAVPQHPMAPAASWPTPYQPSSNVEAQLASTAKAVEGLAVQLQHMAVTQTQLLQQFSQLLAQQQSLLDSRRTESGQ